jgi:hypothetical protein
MVWSGEGALNWRCFAIHYCPLSPPATRRFCSSSLFAHVTWSLHAQMQHLYIAEDYAAEMEQFAAPRTDRGLSLVRPHGCTGVMADGACQCARVDIDLWVWVAGAGSGDYGKGAASSAAVQSAGGGDKDGDGRGPSASCSAEGTPPVMEATETVEEGRQLGRMGTAEGREATWGKQTGRAGRMTVWRVNDVDGGAQCWEQSGSANTHPPPALGLVAERGSTPPARGISPGVSDSSIRLLGAPDPPACDLEVCAVL